MFSKPWSIVVILVLLMGCNSRSISSGKVSIGVVSFGESDRSVEQYAELKTYLGSQLNSIIELEPTYNEVQAIQEIQRQRWDIVFAPPGLAAISISQSQYQPLFPLEGALKTRSIIVVLQESPIANLSQLGGKVIGLGQSGSATGYYLPIYNLYGLTVAEVRFGDTPKTVLNWIASGEVAAGAMSLADFSRYRSEFPTAKFRILHTDSHEVPSGAILVSPKLTADRREQIRQTLGNVSSAVAASTGYITNAPVPDYEYLIEVVDRVNPIAERIKQTPAPLYESP